MKIHGIDTVVIGEADELALDLFHDLEAGEAPELLHTFVRNIENIPMVRGPTINSLIEAMRGCGRGCDFCDVNKRSKKDIPLSRLQEEAKINLKYGFDSVWLQSDEMLLYGCATIPYLSWHSYMSNNRPQGPRPYDWRVPCCPIDLVDRVSPETQLHGQER
jgi:radical SAM superfamily enzyme YgiQ (UPF0313 family)